MNIALLLDAQDFMSTLPKITGTINWYMLKFLRVTLLGLVMLTMIRDTFFEPIFCWVPRTWTEAYVEFVRCYCWSHNTYIADMSTDIHPHPGTDKDREEINYYQWVPLFILALVPPLSIPEAVWKCGSGAVGNAANVFHKITHNLQLDDVTKKEETINYICHVIKMLLKKNNNKQKQNSHKLVWSQVTLSTVMVYSAFFISKLLNVVVLLLEMYAMKWYLGMDSLNFGLENMKYMTTNSYLPQNASFPIITWCQIPIKGGGTNRFHAVHCVLPGNILNIRLFLLIWILLTIGIAIAIYDFIRWVVCLLLPNIIFSITNRRAKLSTGSSFIRKHLELVLHSNEKKLKELRHKMIDFEKLCLGPCGWMLLEQLNDSVQDESVLHLVLKQLFDDWCENPDSRSLTCNTPVDSNLSDSSKLLTSYL